MALLAQSSADTEQKIAALEQQAEKFLKQQKPQSAVPVLREIVALDPKNLNAQGESRSAAVL